ncbi:MAG: tetratricopeptide repeat protein [Opitutae bacterium]
MSKKEKYEPGFDPTEKRTRSILFGTVFVEQFGYSRKVYSLNVRRIAGILPFLLFGIWLMASEFMYFRERYMNGITTTRRADIYLFYYDSAVDSTVNFFLTPEEVGIRNRRKIIDYDPTKDHGKVAHLNHKGEYFISVAKAALARGDFGEFVKYIGTGASLTPKNAEAQKLCADLYFAFGRSIDAFQILENSLDYGLNDPEIFKNYLTRCFMLDQDTRVINTAKKYLPNKNLSPVIREDLKLAEAQANFFRGNYNEASKLIRDYTLETNPEGFLLRCQLMYELGEKPEAIKLLNSAIKNYPGVMRLLEIKARWLKDMGNLKEARDCLDLIIISNPENFSPYIQSLHLMTSPENADKRNSEIEKIIKKYAKNEQAMLELAQYGNDNFDAKLTARLLTLAEQSRFPSRTKFALTHAECLINANRPHEAILLIDELISQIEREQWLADTKIALDALKCIAYFADDQPEIGLINLTRLLENRRVPPQLLIATGKKLIQAKRFVEANNMLIQAHLMNENNQPLLLQIVKLKIEHPEIANDVEVYIRRLMDTRRPPREVLISALNCVSSDTYLFSNNREKLQLDIEKMINQ